MLVKLILCILPFLRIVSALGLTNSTAAYGDSHTITTGAWTKADCGYSTSTLNSSVSLSFNGVSVHVLGDLSLYGGVVQITLDGQPAELIDLYGVARCGQVLFSRTGLANGSHLINVTLTGESRNVTSTGGPARLFVFKNFIWTSSTLNSSSPFSSMATGTAAQLMETMNLWKRQSGTAAAPPPVVPRPTPAPPPVVPPPAPPPTLPPTPPPSAAPPPVVPPPTPPLTPPPTPPPPVTPPPPPVTPRPSVATPAVVPPATPPSVTPPPVVPPVTPSVAPPVVTPPSLTTTVTPLSVTAAVAPPSVMTPPVTSPSVTTMVPPPVVTPPSSMTTTTPRSVTTATPLVVTPPTSVTTTTTPRSVTTSTPLVVTPSTPVTTMTTTPRSVTTATPLVVTPPLATTTPRSVTTATPLVATPPTSVTTTTTPRSVLTTTTTPRAVTPPVVSSRPLPPSPTTSQVSQLPLPPTDSPSKPSTSPPPYRPPKYIPPPTSTLASELVPTVTAAASGPTPDLSGVIQLWTCKPYGSKDCVFNPQEPVGVNTYSLIVGAPTKNCGGSGNSVAVVGGQITISDTWSQDLTAGLSLGGAAGDLRLNTSATELWQNSETRVLSQVVRMTIPPNSQGALVAEVAYNSTNGTMQIGNELPFRVVANQPQNDVSYVANIVPCDAQINGNFTPIISAATQSMKPYSHAVVVIVALAVQIFKLS